MSFDFPNAPNINDTFTDPISGAVYKWNGYAWVGGGPNLANLIVSDTPPTTPSDNALWWESDTGFLFLYYNDGNSKQWIQINSLSDAAYLKKAGVIDGSDALAGQIGEYISLATGNIALPTVTQTNLGSISLPAGDWDVDGFINFAGGFTAANNLQAYLTTVSATPPTAGGPGRSVHVGASFQSSTMMVTGTARFSLSAATLIYLGAYISLQTGTCTANGTIRARRVR